MGGGWYLTDVENSRIVYLFSYTEKNKLHWWVESILFLSVIQESAYKPFNRVTAGWLFHKAHPFNQFHDTQN